MDKEIWKDIVDYEGLYAVSNKGRVKSLERVDSLGRRVNEKILSPGKDGKGYLRVDLCKAGSHKMYKVHRLVLMTFSPVANMENLEVNHIDENKENNQLNNLEWITHKDNQNHGTRNKRIAEKNSIPLVQLTIEGRYIRSYKSSMDAQRLGGFANPAINACCKKKYSREGNNIYKGYRFMYLSEYMDKYNGIID